MDDWRARLERFIAAFDRYVEKSGVKTAHEKALEASRPDA
jgi:hypothetical protein